MRVVPHRRCCGCCAIEQSSDFKLLRCGKCQIKYYCSEKCQLADWPAHKILCVGDGEENRRQVKILDAIMTAPLEKFLREMKRFFIAMKMDNTIHWMFSKTEDGYESTFTIPRYTLLGISGDSEDEPAIFLADSLISGKRLYMTVDCSVKAHSNAKKYKKYFLGSTSWTIKIGNDASAHLTFVSIYGSKKTVLLN